MLNLSYEFFTAPTKGNISGGGKNGRDYKGSSAREYVEDYCVLDLETTSSMLLEAEIVEVSAIKVRNGEVEGEFSTLINPLCHIPSEASSVNHITDDMVSDAPTLEAVVDDLVEFIGEDVIVGYNNAGYDMNIIYDKLKGLRGVYFNNSYIDVLHAARRVLSDLKDYRLMTICEYYGIDTSGSHRALKDCYLTKACYECINNEYGSSAFRSFRNRASRPRVKKYSDKTIAIKEFQNMLAYCLEDGVITLDEIGTVDSWLSDYEEYHCEYPFNRIIEIIDDVGDTYIDDIKEKMLLDAFEEVINPVKANSEEVEQLILSGANVCVTGEFKGASRSEIEAMVEAAGANWCNSVTKSLNYLVVGANGSENWNAGNFGSKVKKAIEMNEKYESKGVNIRILEEEAFMKAITNPEPVQIAEETQDNSCQLTNKEINCEPFDWTVPVRSMLDELIKEKELPEHSLYLLGNVGKKTNSITSYTISIYEPEYPKIPNKTMDPSKNATVLNIQHLKRLMKNKIPYYVDLQELELVCDADMVASIGVPEGCRMKQRKSDNGLVRVCIDRRSPVLCSFIKAATEYQLRNYESKADKFGCCSRFIECSDAKHCVHPNKLYACACYYKKNLDNGKIFYGKNKNID